MDIGSWGPEIVSGDAMGCRPHATYILSVSVLIWATNSDVVEMFCIATDYDELGAVISGLNGRGQTLARCTVVWLLIHAEIGYERDNRSTAAAANTAEQCFDWV